MDEGRPSVTAMVTALMRATHTRLGNPPLIEDPWGDRLVLDTEKEALRRALASTGATDDLDAALSANPTFATVVLRTRYTEDALRAVVEGGTLQYVILGAGMDSFALRRPPFARNLEVFEVDHPATQAFKARRLEESGIRLPAGLHMVPADLGEIGLEAALAGTAFRPAERAFFSWLGVTSYLTREANLATLRAVASAAARGSELVFTYIDQRELEPEGGELREIRDAVALSGERWVSGFHPDELGRVLEGAGLDLVEDLDGHELAARYQSDGLSPARTIHVARARVA